MGDFHLKIYSLPRLQEAEKPLPPWKYTIILMNSGHLCTSSLIIVQYLGLCKPLSYYSLLYIYMGYLCQMLKLV